MSDESELKPLLCGDDEKDERFDGVKLLEYSDEHGEELKTTAEDCGDYWCIRDWETTTNGETEFWFCRWSYTIAKKHINLLAA